MRMTIFLIVVGLCMGAVFTSTALGFSVSLNVNGLPKDGSPAAPITSYRWLIEEDTTHPVTPGVPDSNSLAFSFHKSHAPVVVKGDQTNAANISLPDGKRYFVSVLPNEGYTIGGAPIANGQTAVTVICNQLPLPTAQITVFVFEDNNPINNAPDASEPGLAGFKVIVTEAGGRYGVSGGQAMLDAFGNMIGTTYRQNSDGTYVLDADGNPAVVTPGQGFVLTDANGNATIKHLSPGKYGMLVAPPSGQGWQQTSTIEGTKTIDAWVKADEPPFFSEFGPAGWHVFVGFVKQFTDTAVLSGGSTISGQVVNLHMSRPPAVAFYPGEPHPNAWVGLNAGQAGTGPGLYAAPCDPDTGEFSIPNVPPGTYQLVFWDKYLDNIFAFLGVTVPPGGAAIELGEVGVFRWFGTLLNKVFYDGNENGIRDANETYVFPEQAINLRFRDGSLYQSMATDNSGESPLEEIFPFFNWLVAEVDFLRFKATGMTATVDAGGGPLTPGSNINPQVQAGGGLSRTETGPVLTQGFQLFLGQTSSIEWGKKEYGPTENGGISGIVYYANTRAENDPRYAVGDPWEPGIPRVQINLYADGGAAGSSLTPTPNGVIDDLDGDGQVTLADVDNYPFQWAPLHQDQPGWTGVKGPEDLDRNGNGVFDAGDAIAIATTDSWDDNTPTDCPGDPTDPFYQGGKCYDGLRNFNQIRPAVFDGGYAFTEYVPGGVTTGAAAATLPQGTYIVEATRPPGYELVKEEDRNVDFGDTYTPSLLLLPPVCVGDAHTVPAELALFAGTPAPFAGQSRPLCDRKQVNLNNGQNTAADFFLFTEVPKAGRFVGFILNDLANEFNPATPSFGEKFAPPWLPVSIRDYRGTEISRVYSDEYGAYNALVPSTFTANRPMPSGFAPNMLTVVINDPFKPDPNNPGQVIEDDFYNPLYSTFQYTFQYMPAVTTYLDTPVLPIAAFASPNSFPVDAEFPDGTPVVSRVDGTGIGPWVSGADQQITITSMGIRAVPNPSYNPTPGPTQNLNRTINRDFGFGADTGTRAAVIRPAGGGADVPLVIDNWDNDVILATVPGGAPSGQLIVTRGDNGKSSVVGIYLTVGGTVPIRVPADFPTIQEAIDAAPAGSLVLVEPGTYDEMVILYKNIRLQGTGAGVTNIRAFKIPADKLQAWRKKVDALQTAGSFDLLPGQAPGLDTFKNEFGPGIIVLGADAARNSGRIDGFRISGADQGGAILVNGYTQNFLISNNRISGNEGFYGGGIRVGHPELIAPAAGGEQEHVDAQNDGITIQHNHIAQNGGLNGAGGGVSIHTGADGYIIRRNFIVGNFTSGSGGGIGHLGLSNNGLIELNTITFNQSFNQGLTVIGGGVLISGLPTLNAAALPAGPGSGAVTIDNNRIQSNMAGAGDGGGIALRSTNQDLIVITDNVIVNNVTGLAGGGISLQDAANVTISTNTIAMNDSTATASLAFPNGVALPSVNQPAGIVSRAHTPALNTALGVANGFSNPGPFAANIIWQNRTFSWDPTLVPPALVPAPPTWEYWDLGVLGAAGPMNPTASVLTSLAGFDGADYTGNGNNTADPILAGAYFNAARGIPGVTEVTAIQTAIAADEGGNAIDVAFGPLTYTGAYTDQNPAVGPNALVIGVLNASGGGGGGGGGGWACLISAASEEAVSGNMVLAFATILVILAAAPALLRSRFTRRGTLFMLLLITATLIPGLAPTQAGAEVRVQCPDDTNGNGIPPVDLYGNVLDPGDVDDPDVACAHLAAGDGFINMADGKLQYMFGFSDVTGMPPADVMSMAMFGANFPAPTIKVKEGQKLYLTLTNVGMMARPDLFDPHTVHYHGFPNASAVFDGVPDASISINMGASLTYFYYNAEPGTFLYHCHVEATEHMQMGMLGQLYVTPIQDGTTYSDPDGSGRVYTKFAYNDGDGSTGYHVDYPIQIASFDPAFHDASLTVQPLPFALMQDKYPMLNGRGYPDTVNPDPLPNTADQEGYMMMDPMTRKVSALITATQGQKILLRISSLSTTSFHTISALGIPMKVVGRGARILRGPTGKNLFYNTSSVDLGGGEAADVILDTKDVAPGTYFLYVTNLNHLSNDGEDYGGMMTEIVVNAAQ
jgi:FtsP/CotA-like multicopper oxidase with cupredoxin domain